MLFSKIIKAGVIAFALWAFIEPAGFGNWAGHIANGYILGALGYGVH